MVESDSEIGKVAKAGKEQLEKRARDVTEAAKVEKGRIEKRVQEVAKAAKEMWRGPGVQRLPAPAKAPDLATALARIESKLEVLEQLLRDLPDRLGGG
jgi:hypothetical protein